MTKAEAINAFIYGGLRIVVTPTDYQEFLHYVTTVAPKLRWANGKSAEKWNPADISYVIWVARYPSSYFLAVSPYNIGDTGLLWSTFTER